MDLTLYDHDWCLGQRHFLNGSACVGLLAAVVTRADEALVNGSCGPHATLAVVREMDFFTQVSEADSSTELEAETTRADSRGDDGGRGGKLSMFANPSYSRFAPSSLSPAKRRASLTTKL